MDYLLEDFLRRFWLDVTPLLDWAITNWAVTLAVLLLALFWRTRNRSQNL